MADEEVSSGNKLRIEFLKELYLGRAVEIYDNIAAKDDVHKVTDPEILSLVEIDAPELDSAPKFRDDAA